MLSDSDKNIMRDLQHEACEEHCEDCGACCAHETLWVTDDPLFGAVAFCEDCDEEIEPEDQRHSYKGRIGWP